FHDYVINGAMDRVNPAEIGTKAAAVYKLVLAPGETRTLRLRLTNDANAIRLRPAQFERTVDQRKKEADEFYRDIIPQDLSADGRNVMRQSLAGLLWSKQFYHYVVRDWLNGDPTQPAPPVERRHGRNRDWSHLYNADVISMPDKWEYPWYAAWD